MNYRDGYIGRFIVKPNALTIKVTGSRIETRKENHHNHYNSYVWVRADDEYLYLYYGCNMWEENAPGSVCIVIAVKDAELVRE